MTSNPTPTYAGMARLYWMFVGLMLSALFAYRILTHGGGWSTTTDLVFLLSVAALPLARWAEFLGGSPQTAEGDPASAEHLRRYVVITPLV